MAARPRARDPEEGRPLRPVPIGAVAGAVAASAAVALTYREPGVESTVVGLAAGGAVFLLCAVSLARFRARTRRSLRSLRAADARDQGVDVSVLASSVGHDINNLLQVCAVQLAELREAVADRARVRGLAEELSATLDEIGRLAASLLAAGRRGDGGGLEAADLGVVLRESAEIARRHRAMGRCVLHLDLAADGARRARVDLLRRAVFNLLINAGEAGAKRVLLRFVPRNGEVLVEVHDDGPGVPEEERARVFESFVSTKGGGRGLGLTAARVLVREQGGDLGVGASPLGGACFRLGLQAARVHP